MLLYVLLKIHVASRPVAVLLIKHRPVFGGLRTGIGRFVKGFSKAPAAFQTSNDALQVAVESTI